MIKLAGLFSFPKRKLKKLVSEGEYKEAIEFGKSLEQKNPDDSDLLFIMGSIFYILQDAKTALSYFDRVLEINGYDQETLLLKANVHVFLKEYDIAIECCNKVLDVDFENMEAKNILERIKAPNGSFFCEFKLNNLGMHFNQVHTICCGRSLDYTTIFITY